MKLTLLRFLMLLDAAVLFLLGAFLILQPMRIEQAFHFQDLPAAVSYLIGLWGCVLVTLAWGYVVAATNPLRHRVWVQVGIARGAFECLLGIIYLVRGTVNFQQGSLGIIVAGLISFAYVALYPRKPRPAEPIPAPTSQPAAPPS